MKVYVVFLPMKYFRWYNSLGCAPDMYCIEGDVFGSGLKMSLDKYMALQLEAEAKIRFGKSVKLIGYDYKQINKDGRSYYPMYAVTGNQIMGIQWITWRSSLYGNSNEDEYFILRSDISNGKIISAALPEDIRFCTDEETADLQQFNVAIRSDILLQKNVTLKYTKQNIGENFGFTFYYEFAFQVTEKLIELTGVNDFDKLAVFNLYINFVDCDVWTYSSFSLIREPEWIEPNKRRDFFFRWKSTKGGYIHPRDSVSEGDVVFELCNKIPECAAFDKDAVAPSKLAMLKFLDNDWLEAMHNEYDEKERRANAFIYRYRLYVYCNKYTAHFPKIHIKIQFVRKLSAKANAGLFSKIESMLSEYGITGLPETLKANPYCHGWNQECSSMELIFSFGNAPQSAVLELLRLLDANGKNIKYVELTGVTYESLSEDIAPTTTNLKSHTEKYYFELDFEPANYPDVIFDFFFETMVSSVQKAKILDEIENYIADYNKANGTPIHYTEAENVDTKDDNFRIFVDFGGAEPDAVYGILNYINLNIKGIKKIVIS